MRDVEMRARGRKRGKNNSKESRNETGWRQRGGKL